MISSEIGLHSFLKYIQRNLSTSLCTRNEWHNKMRIIKQIINRDFFNVFLINPNFDRSIFHKKDNKQKMYQWIWAFVVIPICVEVIYFSYGEWTCHFLQSPAYALFYTFWMRICAYFGVRSNTIDIDFVLGVKETLIRDLYI